MQTEKSNHLDHSMKYLDTESPLLLQTQLTLQDECRSKFSFEKRVLKCCKQTATQIASFFNKGETGKLQYPPRGDKYFFKWTVNLGSAGQLYIICVNPKIRNHRNIDFHVDISSKFKSQSKSLHHANF